ncbi:MAG TPA: rhomboid family intramembrane serine protease [Longimicrobium sp.]|nr:rhomboid family intramembrane serine protease [Longimicrobium sp.]
MSNDLAHQGWAPAPYGYVDDAGVPVPTDRESLLARCVGPGAERPEGVWTPESGGVVPPWEVPWIFAAMMAPAIDAVRGQLKTGGVVFAITCVLFLPSLFSEGSSGPPLLLILSGMWLAQVLLAYRQVRTMTPAKFAGEIEEARRLPPAREGTAVYTRALAAMIGVVAVAQVVSPGTSFDTAGLVKDAVRRGEWWRLLTAPLLHGNPMHLLFNGMTLLALGTLVERYAHAALVPLVFVAAALAGGLASVALYPNTTSVGASGGIMGLIGFALVLSLRRRELLPRSLFRDLLADVGWIALMGLAAYRYIDNAAHAGGLLAGVLLALLLVPRGGHTPHWEPSAAMRAAGWICLGVVGTSALLAVAAMFGVV